MQSSRSTWASEARNVHQGMGPLPAVPSVGRSKSMLPPLRSKLRLKRLLDFRVVSGVHKHDVSPLIEKWCRPGAWALAADCHRGGIRVRELKYPNVVPHAGVENQPLLREVGRKLASWGHGKPLFAEQFDHLVDGHRLGGIPRLSGPRTRHKAENEKGKRGREG